VGRGIASAARLTAVLLACGAAAAVPAAAHAKPQAPAQVVGAGAIYVPELAVHALPAPTARVIARLTEFRPEDFRPRLVLAIDVLEGTAGRPTWYRIVVPGRPNGRTGWVRASQVRIKPTPVQIVVRRESRRLELWRGRARVFSTQAAVGAPGMETPLGLFHVTSRFRPVRQPFLGTFAFETSAYSRLSEWPGGGVVGIHGTTQPWLLGRAVSHGCIRISNQAADFLKRRVPVGTPIRIVRA
jgi:lipoprotein-anchoring transpeptidase ErfK/SrfK